MTAQDIEPAAAFLAVDAYALRETVERFPGVIDTQSLNGAEESLMAALDAIRSAKGVTTP